MKNLVLLLSCCFLSMSVLGSTYKKAKLLYIDGTEKEGFVKVPKLSSDKYISFKESKESEREKVPSEELHLLYVYVQDQVLEYEQVRTYKQTLRGTKISHPLWLEVLRRGRATLYFATGMGIMEIDEGTGQRLTWINPPDNLWYCLRKNEEAATLVSWTFPGCVNKNNILRKKGAKYFSDNPGLSRKIKKKQYKWDEIETIVDIYNGNM